tara:strand:+ start:686 stop:1063 length:378 start_codon:yes stop_codon:yes gene_type:complete
MSTLKVATIQDTSGNNSSTPNQVAQGRAKAWVNFNGKGTIAINDDFNVSSIGDNGTGRYTVNFTTAMSNANYAVAVSGSDENESDPPSFFGCACESFTTSNFKMFTRRSSGIEDMKPVCAVVFGD